MMLCTSVCICKFSNSCFFIWSRHCDVSGLLILSNLCRYNKWALLFSCCLMASSLKLDVPLLNTDSTLSCLQDVQYISFLDSSYFNQERFINHCFWNFLSLLSSYSFLEFFFSSGVGVVGFSRLPCLAPFKDNLLIFSTWFCVKRCY